MKTHGVIVIGGYINGLGLLRALASRGIPRAVITTKPYDIAQYSRCIAGHAAALDLGERPESLLEVLERRASEWKGWALLPSNDEALAALALHHERLSAAHLVMGPMQGVADYFLDKAKMLELARAVGLSVPRWYRDAAGVPFPVLVKPLAGYRFAPRFGCKLFVARDRKALDACLAQAAAADCPCLLQEYVPGPDSEIHVYCLYVDGNGEPSAGLTLRKLRQSPPFFGVARMMELIEHNPALREATVEMARRIGFRGILEAEFKRDARDGTFRFLEFNGRSILSNALLRKGGMDVAWLAWSDYVEGRPEVVRANGWPGVWVNLHADLAYSTLYRHLDPISLREFVTPYRRPVLEAVWSWRDPLPFAVQWTRLRGTSAPKRAPTPSGAPL